ncbi:restriction enzyme BgcI subunit beta [Streptococcus pseudoporcinus]|uniref:Restriction enzyme BgcI subunit beta n=1 Tax=Streptococcus pseudoporcinus TaxID=361101 RepID=A0A4U9XTT0_9STRE|nr:restriction enzyme BgcI subunit beta [Streptococcus pseudoporcinus]
MFDSENGDFDIQKSHINDIGEYVITAGLTNNGILGKTNISAKVIDGGTITIDMFGNSFYRYFKYKMVTHARVFSLIPKFDMSKEQGLYIVNSFKYLIFEFGYENMCSWAKIQNRKIQLPTKNGEIDFEFMDAYISELEEERISELSAYLTVSGLDNYEFSSEEKEVLENLNFVEWEVYNLERIFGKSTRGKRLKSDDRINGTLPFVTAGEANTGISDFIGNDVEVFSKNTITIDMFGSAKYRNYNYGGDDHIAVVHTEKIKPESAIFVTSAIHKSSYNGQFNYGRNFYAKDADALNIMLPTKDNEIDFSYMELLISAVKKLVIKDVVHYADSKIEVTKKVVTKN